MFSKVLVANRGEIAIRVMRALEELGIASVAVYSEADRDAPWTEGREQVVLGPARSTHSYLAMTRIVQAAVQTNCTALHPGWGFLAENPAFVTACEENDLVFVGPDAEVMARMGDKTQAKTVQGLGLRKLNSSVSLADTPETRGMIHKVRHLVTVTE